MKLQQGTGVPKASTLERQLRFSGIALGSAPAAMQTTQVPVEATAKGIGRVMRWRRKEALLSWMPTRTLQSDGRAVWRSTSGVSGPATSLAFFSGGKRWVQPIFSVKLLKVPSTGRQRPPWQPKDVT